LGFGLNFDLLVVRNVGFVVVLVVLVVVVVGAGVEGIGVVGL